MGKTIVFRKKVSSLRVLRLKSARISHVPYPMRATCRPPLVSSRPCWSGQSNSIWWTAQTRSTMQYAYDRTYNVWKEQCDSSYKLNADSFIPNHNYAFRQ
jgi:hypothetical protein